MKNKGFTLIELLAVIVILAIIALIATPIILNIISDSKEESNKRSVELYGKAVEQAVAKAQLKYVITPGTYTSSSDGKILSMEGIEPLTVEYNGNVYCDTIEIFEDGNIYLANCTVNGKSVEYAYGKSKTLKENILSNYGGESNITIVTDFNTVTPGLYKAEDDLGTSYYFRGNVDNNYVQFGTYEESDVKYHFNQGVVFSTVEECESTYEEWFASSGKDKCDKAGGEAGDKMYWRIVRINGDGTIRLAYAGTELVENGINYNQAIIGSNSFTLEYKNSESKSYVDKWYAKHLDKNYSKYISDSTFCNDTEEDWRKYYVYDENYQLIETTDSNAAESTQINYKAFARLPKSPKFVCSQEKDIYTVNGENGNGLLTYPIGLLSADEIVFAGKGNSSYLYSLNSNYLTMTPSFYFDYYSGLFYYGVSYGSLDNQFLDAGSPTFTTRPVINLKADVKFIGSGTIDDPYVIVTE